MTEVRKFYAIFLFGLVAWNGFDPTIIFLVLVLYWFFSHWL